MIKGGAIAWAPIGDANASIPTPQPVLGRPMFGAAAAAAAAGSLAFVAPAGAATTVSPSGSASARELRRRRRHPRRRQGATCRNNDAMPEIARRSARRSRVTVDGERSSPRPPSELPLAQRYSLF